MLRRGFLSISILAVLLLAQDPYGRVTGRVMDATGAVVAGAGIQMTNVETNVVSRGGQCLPRVEGHDGVGGDG
ncbi:MAG: hypothetical protein AAB403_08915 [Planctomycetota bacterium]